MYLKRLEVRGFKSFASKTVFDFEPGITAIVGPNGSGKSNVVDALAWVMGEQGAKNLRGGKMEDVIFAGTSGRKPLGRAQVSLTIDNTDGALPIEYSEVTISRTLFRSGGSEYEINGSPARLLDIQELLSDSGLGREMHVIVGQGQLDRILQATPEERRGFIEEAAGILKHRRRKERSVRKLESMRGNLDRVRDLTEEVRRQLGPLSRQAETARKAQRIQFDVRDARARLLADDIEQQQARVAQFLADDQGLERQLAELNQQLTTLQTSRAELAQQVHLITDNAAAAREHRYGMAGLQERYRSLLNLTQERLRSASAPLVKSSGLSAEEAEKQVAQTEAELQSAVTNREQATRELAEATEHKEHAERAARIAAKAYTDSLQAEADRQRAISAAETKLANAQARLDTLLAQREQSSSENQYREETVADFQQQIEQIQQEVEQAQADLDAAQEELGAADEAVKQSRDALKAKEDELQRLNTQRAQLQTRIQVLTEALRPARGSAREALSELDLAELTELFRVDDGWDRAIAKALGLDMVDQVWSPNDELIEQALVLLSASDVGAIRLHHMGSAQTSSNEIPSNLPAGFLPATQVVHPHQNSGGAEQAAQFEAVLGRLLSRTFLVEDLDQAERQLTDLEEAGADLSECRWITRSGEVLTAGWLEVAGAAKETNGASAADTPTDTATAQRAAIDDAQNFLAQLTEQLETVKAAIDTAQTKVGESEENRRELRTSVQEIRSRATGLRERLSATQTSLEQTERNHQRLAQQARELDQRIEQAQRQLAEAQEAQETALAAERVALAQQEQEQSSGEQAPPSQEEQERTEAAARQARQVETDLRLKVRTLEASEDQARSRVEQAKRRVSSARLAEQEYARALARQQHATARLGQLEAGIGVALEKIGNAVTRADSDEHALSAQRDELVQQRDQLDEGIQAQSQRLEEAKERNHARQLARQEQQLLLDQLQQKSLDELGYTHEYLVTTYGTDQPVVPYQDQRDSASGDAQLATDEQPYPYVREEQQKRLKKAERELRALGKVNPLALEEYNSVQERHQFLSTQLADLEQSRKDLLNIIEEVDATVLKVFGEAFADTAEQFQHVFSVLFPGGEGELTLTEPDNMLETGVEVRARPAGKKVSRLSLLSGGERSLAAIALLVSIFKARPSPFYVMDEVEAALDDTNLSRLLRIFKELQEDSQLIIITHQQRTMEIADALYGVSMRGDGISQVIGQRLDQDDA